MVISIILNGGRNKGSTKILDSIANKYGTRFSWWIFVHVEVSYGAQLRRATILSDTREAVDRTWDRLVAVAAYIGIERHGRRLEWRPLTSNVYYSSHSDTRKSSLLCIRTSVENGGPPPRLWIPSPSHTYVFVHYRDACRATVSYASLASLDTSTYEFSIFYQSIIYQPDQT